MRSHLLLPLILIPACLTAMAYPAVQHYRQWSAELQSVCNCEDNGLEAWGIILKTYADQHGGKLPDSPTRKRLAEQYQKQSSNFILTCDTKAPYQWDNTVTKTDSRSPRPLIWCGHPHGVTKLWRNVLFSDMVVRHVPEARFSDSSDVRKRISANANPIP